MKQSSTSQETETISDADGAPAEQVLAAEQDERRRIALFLHDGPVQSLSGVALTLVVAPAAGVQVLKPYQQ